MEEVLESILNLKNEDFLQLLYQYREENNGIIREKTKKETKRYYIQIIKEEKNMKETINKYIPKRKKYQRREIINAINNYIDELNTQNAVYNEEYYKQGIKDGLMLILNCI